MNISLIEATALKELISAHAGDDDVLNQMRDRLDQDNFIEEGDRLHAYVKKHLCDDERVIDDTAALSHSDEGVFVSTWVWVPSQELDDLGLGSNSET